MKQVEHFWRQSNHKIDITEALTLTPDHPVLNKQKQTCQNLLGKLANKVVEIRYFVMLPFSPLFVCFFFVAKTNQVLRRAAG